MMFVLEDGDTGEAILPKAPGWREKYPEFYALILGTEVAPVEKVRGRSASLEPDARVKLLIGLSRWERAGMLAWIAASKPDVFDDAAKALGYT